jgi:hypothetical protein
MTIIDVGWAICWFLIGLGAFQFKGIKSLFDTVTGVLSVFSLFMILLKPDPIAEAFTSIGLGYISGIFTFNAYLIGANISRYYQFGEMSHRIILYVLLLPVWIFLEIKF